MGQGVVMTGGVCGGLLAPWRLPKALVQRTGVCGALCLLGLPLSWGGDSPLRGLYLTWPSPVPLSVSHSISENGRSLSSFLPAKSKLIKRAFVERRFDNRAVAVLEHLSIWSVWRCFHLDHTFRSKNGSHIICHETGTLLSGTNTKSNGMSGHRM